MKQVFDTNLIEFVIAKGFGVEKADRHSYHVKRSGGLHLFLHGFYCFATQEKGNILGFAKQYLSLSFLKAVGTILGVRAYGQTRAVEMHVPKGKRAKVVLPKADGD